MEINIKTVPYVSIALVNIRFTVYVFEKGHEIYNEMLESDCDIFYMIHEERCRTSISLTYT